MYKISILDSYSILYYFIRIFFSLKDVFIYFILSIAYTWFNNNHLKFLQIQLVYRFKKILEQVIFNFYEFKVNLVYSIIYMYCFY